MFSKFNRVLLASGLVLTSLVGFGSSAFAADEAEIENAPYHQVTYTKALDIPAINLLNEAFAETTLDMGEVNVKSNGATGFKVSVKAADATSVQLNNATHAMNIDYKVKYADQTAVTPTTTPQMVGTEGFVAECASKDGCDRTIKLVIPAAQWDTLGVKAGTYKASLVFSIAAP